jgi:hypothetical protein
MTAFAARFAETIGLPSNGRITMTEGPSQHSQAGTTAFTVKSWMVAVILFLAGQLGVSIWWGATLTANQVNRSQRVENIAGQLEEAAGVVYTASDARVDKETLIRLHDAQAEKIADLRNDLRNLQRAQN